MDQKMLEALERQRKPMSIAEEKRLFRGILYGDFGAGKTSLAAEIVRILGGDACWITTDSAWVVLDKFPDLQEKIHRLPYTGFSQLRSIAQAHDEGIEPYSKFRTLVWDTVSTSTQNTLTKLVEKGEYFPSQQLSPELEGYPQYRMAERGMTKTVEALRNSQLNIIFIAHVRLPNENDEKKGKYAIRPNMPEASYKVIAQESQLIGYLHKPKKSDNRMLQVEGTLTEAAKSQIPTIPEATYKVESIPPLIHQWMSGNYQVTT
jgi:hypothetical protein